MTPVATVYYFYAFLDPLEPHAQFRIEKNEDNRTLTVARPPTFDQAWQSGRWIDGWLNNTGDYYWTWDIDNDGAQEILVSGPPADPNGPPTPGKHPYTGVLKWNGKELTCPWLSPSPLTGPAGQWLRNTNDSFGSVEPGAMGVTNLNGWYGTLTWIAGNLELTHMAKR